MLEQPLLALRVLKFLPLIVAASTTPVFGQISGAELDDLQQRRSELDATRAAGNDNTKDNLTAFVQTQRAEIEFGAKLTKLVDEAANSPDSDERQQVVALVKNHFKTVDASIKRTLERMEAVRDARSSAEPAELLDFEYQLRDYDELMSALLQEQLRNTERAARLNLDPSPQIAGLDELLLKRGQQQSDRMEVTGKRIDSTREQIKTSTSDLKSALEQELVALEERLRRIKLGLSASIELLRERGHDASEYTQVLIRSTGEISTAIFDSKVVLGLLNQWVEATKASIIENGPAWFFKIIVLTAIIIFFKLLARLTRRFVRKLVSSSKMRFSNLLQDFFVKLASNVVLVFGILIALSQIGIKVGPILAGFGVAGLIIGFALQDTLSNFASGLMILIYRPYDIGDVVEAGGVSGKVQQMNLVSTTILTFDNQKLVVPNNKIWGDVIRNVNSAPTRRVDLMFGISYDDDIGNAEQILRAIVDEHEKVLKEPQPTIKLHKLGDSSVDFVVRPWVESADYWDVYWDVTRSVKERFDASGISIPYPQRDVHVYREMADSQVE